MTFAMTMKGYLTVCRITNLPSIWTNVLCAYLLAAGHFSWHGYLVPALSLSCFYLAGTCLNDVCDATHDLIHRPSRPIPSGAISQRGALHLAACLFAVGFLVFQLVPHVTAWYAVFFLVIAIIWYDFGHNRKPLSVFLMGTCRFLVFAVTALTVGEKIPAAVFVAAGIQSAYVVYLSLAARTQKDDRRPYTMPTLLAGHSMIDGVILALFVDPALLMVGIAGAMLMLGGQKYVMAD